MVGVIISCDNELGGGWEREKVERAAKRHDDDGHGKYIGSRLLLFAAAIMAARALAAAVMAARVLPPQTTGVQ